MYVTCVAAALHILSIRNLLTNWLGFWNNGIRLNTLVEINLLSAACLVELSECSRTVEMVKTTDVSKYFRVDFLQSEQNERR
jgi:hypothetical protein